MTRIISVLATTLLAAGLSAQTFAAELPTSAIFNDEEASQQDVQRVNASQQDVQRVLVDLGRRLGPGRRRHYDYRSRRNYRHYGYPSYSFGRQHYGYPSYSYGRHYGYSPYYRYYGGHGSRRGHSFGRH